MEKIFNYINGELIDPLKKEWLDNYNPSIGEVYSLIPDSTKEDVENAQQAAKDAFPKWSSSTIKERSVVLQKIADLILERQDDLAFAESVDNGKPLALAKRVDIPRAATNMSFFASAILHENSESHQMSQVAINYTLRKPIGVVGCISPWNLPCLLYTSPSPRDS